MLFSYFHFCLFLLCLARAAWKIHLAILQVSSGDIPGALLGFIEAGKLLWSQQWVFRAIGGYLARKGYRAFVVCRKWINRDSDNEGDMN